MATVSFSRPDLLYLLLCKPLLLFRSLLRPCASTRWQVDLASISLSLLPSIDG